MRAIILHLAAWAARWLPAPVKLAIYRFKPLAQIVRRSLNRAAPVGLSQATVAGGDLAGIHLLLDLQSEKDYWLGTYEPELQAAVHKFIQPGMVVYDVGANIGYISLLLARRVGADGRVLAFEALPANLERLQENLILNNATNVSVMPAAVIDSERKITFLVAPSGGMGKAQGSAGRQQAIYHQEIQVDGVSLDGFVFQHGNPAPHAVKMDIEGGEVLALPGMCRLLSESRPLLLLELHGPEAAQQAWETFREANYRLHAMRRGYPEIITLDQLGWKSYVIALPAEMDHQ